MKKIEQIRENYDIITEKDDSDTRKLTSLVRAGLFDQKKLPMLKRALEKDPSKMTMAERKALLELLDSLMSQVLHSQSVYSKIKQNVGNEVNEAKDYYGADPRFGGSSAVSERDMPTIIILKRKSIRVYPDNQKVGLYYSQLLDRYIAIPFGGSSKKNAPFTAVNEAVDYDAAYRDYKKDYSVDDDKDKKLKDPEKLKKFITQKAGEGKIRSVHYAGRPKWLGGDKEKSELKKVANQSFNKSASTMDYVAGHTGVAIHNAVKRLGSYAMSKVKPSAPKSVKESFREKIKQKRQIQEISKDDVIEFGKDVTPVYGTYRSGQRTADAIEKGEYGQAALHGGLTALSAAGDVALATGVGSAIGAGLKGLAAKGASAIAKKTASKEVATGTGSKIAGSAAKGGGAKAASSGVGKLATGAAIGSALSGSSDKSDEDGPKNLTPAKFGMNVKTNKPEPAGVKTGVDTRTSNQYRKSFENVKEETNKDKDDDKKTRRFLKPASRTDTQIKINSPKPAGITTGVDARMRKYERDFYSQQNGDVLTKIKSMVSEDTKEMQLNIGENSLKINNTIAKKIVNVYESLNTENKVKMQTMLNEGSTDSFIKLINFAVRQ